MKYALYAGLSVTLALMVFSIAWGSTPISLAEIGRAFADLLHGEESLTDPKTQIVLDLRLPRALMAVFVGGGLGLVGTLLQTVTRNDLADPFLFGLSSGAAAGAVFVITVTGDALGIWTLPIAAFTGGMLAAAIVLFLVRRLGHLGAEKLILAGLAVSFLFAAITNMLVFSGDQRAAHSVLFWSLGGLGLARWENLPLAMLGFGLMLWFTLSQHRKLDALLAGESTALSLGIAPEPMRIRVFVLSAFATSLFVSVSGVIGFIGLMVPHMARFFTGPLHGRTGLMAALIGANLLLASDLLARTVLAPQELPVGIVTTSLGALFVFLILLPKQKS